MWMVLDKLVGSSSFVVTKNVRWHIGMKAVKQN